VWGGGGGEYQLVGTENDMAACKSLSQCLCVEAAISDWMDGFIWERGVVLRSTQLLARSDGR